MFISPLMTCLLPFTSYTPFIETKPSAMLMSISKFDNDTGAPVFILAVNWREDANDSTSASAETSIFQWSSSISSILNVVSICKRKKAVMVASKSSTKLSLASTSRETSLSVTINGMSSKFPKCT